MVVQPDASIVVVGQAFLPATGGNTTPLSDAAVARLTAAGTLDTSFNGTGELTYSYNLGGNSDDSAAGVALDGTQIAIVGTTAQVSTSSSSTVPLAYDPTVTMLNSNGTFATSFNGNGRYRLFSSSSGLNTTAVAVLVRPSGSLLIGGNASGQNVGELTLGLLLSLTSAGPIPPAWSACRWCRPASAAGCSSSPTARSSSGPATAVTRTTAPPPAIAATSIITTGTGKKTQATGVTITFNTAVNGTMAINLKTYQVLRANGRQAIKLLKHDGIGYNSVTQTLTLRFARKTPVRKGFQVLITPGGIVGIDSQVFLGPFGEALDHHLAPDLVSTTLPDGLATMSREAIRLGRMVISRRRAAAPRTITPWRPQDGGDVSESAKYLSHKLGSKLSTRV